MTHPPITILYYDPGTGGPIRPEVTGARLVPCDVVVDITGPGGAACTLRPLGGTYSVRLSNGELVCGPP